MITSNKFDTKSPYRRNDINHDRKSKQNAHLKEGVLVNELIKTSCFSSLNYLDNKDFEPSVNIPQSTKKQINIEANKKQDKWYKNPLLPLALAPLLALSGGMILTNTFKKVIAKQSEIKKLHPQNQLPSIGRLIHITDDNVMVMYLLTQDPTKKNLVAAFGVVAMSSVGFILKNFVDGVKEIWVKKQETDIKQKVETDLIEIETRSFSGKNTIARNMLSDKTKEIKNIIDKISFNGKGMPIQKENKENNWILPTIAAGVGIASVFLTRHIFKNLKSTVSQIEKNAKKEQESFKQNIEALVNKEGSTIEQLQQELNKNNINKASKKKIEELFKNAKKDGSKFELDIKPKDDYAFAEANEFMGGKLNQTSFLSAVPDITAFFYTMLINPTTQTKALFGLVTSFTALGYIGKTGVEAIKEVQVKKQNAKTEVELQDRLVNVELKNFKAKKEAYIEPLMQDFKAIAKDPKINKEKLAQKADNILFEIKSGPPFVYS